MCVVTRGVGKSIRGVSKVWKKKFIYFQIKFESIREVYKKQQQPIFFLKKFLVEEKKIFFMVDYYHLDRQQRFFFAGSLKREQIEGSTLCTILRLALVTLTGGRN